MTRKLILATRNRHKTQEVEEMLGDGWEILDLARFPEIPEVEETADSFAGNSALKAQCVSRCLPGLLVMADDSGLEVDALGGAPGVYSARYSGAGATDASNREKLLRELSAMAARGKARLGRFRCVLSLARDGELLRQTEGSVEGIIANEAKGELGFGYDPLFIPEGYCQTFGQLGSEVKHSMSHRARALEKMVEFLRLEVA